MKVLRSWLAEFTPLEGSTDDLGEQMSDLGMAVEETTTFGYDGMVVARVLETRAHPKADRIQLVDVDTGDGEALQIACGAFNFAAGDLVPLATVGSVMPNGMEIGRRKMRGEWSNGMLCSAAELGLGADHGGIFVLPTELAVGDDLDAALGLRGEVLWDLEVNPNRPDAMSVIGVARDLAARLGTPFTLPEPTVASSGQAVADHASVVLEDTELCGRFVARVLRGVGPDVAPLAMRLRLALCGMRSISPVVDVSNYVMLELGVPNHAYDLATVAGGQLRVRRARPGERLVTLDDTERELAPDDGLICDGDDRPIGLAGVMGGADTEISDSTTDVLLEAAWWDPPSISRTSRRHGLRSEASARFERGSDPEQLLRAVDRFAELLGVPVDDGACDEIGELPWPRRVPVRPTRVSAVLGSEFSADDITRLLEPIGFECEGSDPVSVTIPTWRYDSATEIDVIEEVARHHGYERLGRTVPRSPDPGSLTPRQIDRRTVRSLLVGFGLDEVMPLPLVGPETHLEHGLDDHRPLGLLNALTSEESTLRTSLRPGLLRSVLHNQRHRAERVELFEIGNVFAQGTPGEELPFEREWVGVALAGADAAEAVRVLRGLAEGLGVDDLVVRHGDPIGGLHPARAAEVVVAGTVIGVVGELDPQVGERLGVEGRVGLLEVDLDGLLEAPGRERRYREVALVPSSDLDLAFVVPDAVPADAVAASLVAAGGDELAACELFDVFRGESLGHDVRSLAFRVRLQAADRTLTDDDLVRLRNALVEAVVTSHGATLRA